MIIFIILVHPKTSVYLNKYVSGMDTMKGVGIRAIIIAGAYIVTSVITKFMIK